MRFHALATDFDGTLAADGRVDQTTLAALERLRASGRRLILVTGRELEDLEQVFPHLELFDRVVAENGALLCRPRSREVKLLHAPPPRAFAEALRARGVQPLAVGRVIVATREPHQATVLDVIRQLGLELQVIFNKGAVMVLPPGVNKATGLGTALKELRLSLHNTVGVGDAENDHAFLRVCECAVAVANALPAIKEQVDLVTSGADGAGVVELIEALLRDDLRQVAPALVRHDPLLGTTPAGDEVRLPYGSRALLLDDPGRVSGVVMHLLGQLSERGYQYCLIDPRGTYQELGESVSLGSRSRPPGEDDLLHLLQQPDQSATVDLCRLRPGDRQAFFTRALARLGELGATTGRPHLLALNAAHELLPAAGAAAPPAAALIAGSLLLVTAQPEQLAGAMLSAVDTVIASGTHARRDLERASAVLGRTPPRIPAGHPAPHQGLVWERGRPEAIGVRLAT